MSMTSPEEHFRRAAEAEEGLPISAGARASHVRPAVDSGRAFYVDLSGIPEERRGSVIDEIRAIIGRESILVEGQGVGRGTALPRSN